VVLWKNGLYPRKKPRGGEEGNSGATTKCLPSSIKFGCGVNQRRDSLRGRGNVAGGGICEYLGEGRGRTSREEAG